MAGNTGGRWSKDYEFSTDDPAVCRRAFAFWLRASLEQPDSALAVELVVRANRERDRFRELP